MKKWCVALILILALCATALGGCDGSTLSPWGEKNAPNNVHKPTNYSVYVCGAVENEGYYQVSEGGTYFQAIEQAGLLQQSSFSPNFYSIVTGDQLAVAVRYTQNDVVYECVNLNNASLVLGLPVQNVPDEVVGKIANYIANYGKIHNKSQLRTALGDDYEDNFYKFYVAEADYEAVD